MKGKVSRCKIYFVCWCTTIFVWIEWLCLFLCKEFRILSFRNVTPDQKKWSITGIYKTSLDSIAFGLDLNTIMKRGVIIQLFDTEIKHKNYCMSLQSQSQSLLRFFFLCVLKSWSSWISKKRIKQHETFLCQC